MKITDFKGEGLAAQVTWKEKQFGIRIDPERLSIRDWDQLKAALADRQSEESQTKLLVDIAELMLTDWEIEDEKGKPFPLSRANIERLPPAVVSQIVDTIFEALNPPASATVSESTSTAEAVAASAPTGT